MVATLLLLALANSLAIIGIYESVQYKIGHKTVLGSQGYKKVEYFKHKMIFWRVKYYGDKWFGEYWTKPFYNCCTCMASIHGTWFFVGALYLGLVNPIIYPAYILIVAGLTTAIVNKIY